MTGQPFDLEAAAAATRGEPWVFTYGGRDFTVTADLPLELLEAYASFANAQIGDDDAGLAGAAAMAPLLESLASLFTSGDEYAAFRALGPGQAELVALMAELARRQGGASLGEPSAPLSSSDDDSARPSRITAVSTA